MAELGGWRNEGVDCYHDALALLLEFLLVLSALVLQLLVEPGVRGLFKCQNQEMFWGGDDLRGQVLLS